ncbi:putative Tetraprenyl-beta-curcumene synthase [Candidatus Hydrogenisulfobacillus filiaventi]|uniref:Putative Tetraprenyl-beta-curcumene synthase n=1 Tax=Candidatus Hydrogenisulfobacillus filiaventi TaxID=2707344 RepID=A0A6F8ZJB9_9FIRM|nr:putative Tetraprenyl-beta-curcumene synthase [Candidatus Hydrogenisulfobacillus filiaventi]
MAGMLHWSAEYLGHVRPRVHALLAVWEARAAGIPDPLLRRLALEALAGKRFHCEGGGVLGGPSRDPSGALLAFVVPYQTLCDFLDSVTDRGPSPSSADLRLLHRSLLDALTLEPGEPVPEDYYRRHPPGRGDGGYLRQLVAACRDARLALPGERAVRPWLVALARRYIALQVAKHGPPGRRAARLQALHRALAAAGPRGAGRLYWWETAAAAGSTLGLFALLRLAAQPRPDPGLVRATYRLYWPWMGALHILLDYLVDLEEDADGGDFNFVTCYPGFPQLEIARARLGAIFGRISAQSRALPDGGFHRYLAQGLLAFYLADAKVRRQRLGRAAWELLRGAGPGAVGLWVASHWARSP